MIRVLCLLIGYVFGMFQTSYLYGMKQGVDIRKQGSGNLGTTNSLRVLGKKAGIIVFIGDFLKTVIPCMATLLIAKKYVPDMAYLYMLYTGFGTVLGHNYPLYLQFKGGKGIACTGGMIFCANVFVAALVLISFLSIVGVTYYVSLGSLIAVTIVAVGLVILACTGALGLAEAVIIEFCILAVAYAVMAFWRHRANIVRLIKGVENKTYLFKKAPKEEAK